MKLPEIFKKEYIENKSDEEINKLIDDCIAYIKMQLEISNKMLKTEKKFINVEVSTEKNEWYYYNEKTGKFNVRNKVIQELLSFKK